MFEEYLLCAAPLELAQCGERLPHGRFCRSRVRGQGDNHRVLIVRRMILAGHANCLGGAHALTHQNIAKISRPDDIVGDSAEENGILFSSSSSLLPG